MMTARRLSPLAITLIAFHLLLGLGQLTRSQQNDRREAKGCLW